MADEDPPPEGTPGKVEDLPPWAREALAKANKEAAGFRTKVRELEGKASKLDELENASKTELDKLRDQIAEAKKESADNASRADRLEVAMAKGLSPTQAKRLMGATREELEADADELLTSFKSPAGDPGGKPPARPTERLKGGGDPTEEPEETDPRKLAALHSRA